MISRLTIAALLMFAAVPLVGVADACISPCGPIVGVCAAGVTAEACTGGHDVCIYGATWAPTCRDIPDVCDTVCPIVTAPPSVQCIVLVGSGAAGGVCYVDGDRVGPIATCDACVVLFYEACSVGTEEVRCWSSGWLSPLP